MQFKAAENCIGGPGKSPGRIEIFHPQQPTALVLQAAQVAEDLESGKLQVAELLDLEEGDRGGA